MNLDEIRRLIIVAVCSDDVLLDTLVLKGGNALSLIHGVGQRSSIDIDFSMESDFADVEDARRRLFQSLRERFDTQGLVVFDEDLRPKPRSPLNPHWGGYLVEFKLIARAKHQALKGSLEDIRRQAEAVGDSSHSRKFRIEISKFEYVADKAEAEIDDYLCYVYTLPMIAAEKLRAICQQMDGYPLTAHPRPRARDFYDIYAIATERALDFARPEFHDLVRHMFAAKDVPLAFLAQIPAQESFHAQDWPAVRDAIKSGGRDFADYFAFVVQQLAQLKPLWEKEPPL